MPRGLPDYYNPDTLVSQRLANVEEIVNHQRGIASLDNRGRTLWFTRFADGVADWYKANVGDGSDPAASTTLALVAPNSMLLAAGTDSGNGLSQATKRVYVKDIRKAGFEFSVYYDADLADTNFGFNYYNGTNRVQGLVRVDRDAKAIQVADNGTPVTVASLPTSAAAGFWLMIKFVVDFENEVYERLLIGLKQYDISEYALELIANSDQGALFTRFTSYPVDDNTNVAYVGHAALTIDEP